jgi:hypothetical protein
VYGVLDCSYKGKPQHAWCVIDREGDDIDYLSPYIFFGEVDRNPRIWRTVGQGNDLPLPLNWEFV